MSVAFGTSGLRGQASAFDAAHVSAYVSAFLEHISAKSGDAVFIGSDLRASSPDIASRVAAAISSNGQAIKWAGVAPTPAIAFAALSANSPAIIVTGSHIPEDYNGIKFYRPDGELLKQDEAPIKKRAEALLTQTRAYLPYALPAPDPAILRTYISRYTNIFPADTLKGLRIGLFEHSAAGRDAMATIFSELGADVMCYGRAGKFIAIDTEALEPTELSDAARFVKQHALDAVISTDGDGDRPLMIDDKGLQINGDILCALAAKALGIKTVVTPLTSTSAIELSGWFEKIIRTRIGSPYVVEAMAGALSVSLQTPVAGFEANGGFLLASNIDLPYGHLAALPTRDAVLPLIAVLAQARLSKAKVSSLAASPPARFMKADRLKNIPKKNSQSFLSAIASTPALQRTICPALTQAVALDQTDGRRFTLADGVIIHFRASGNAPELRAYIETESAAKTSQMLELIMTRLKEHLLA